MHPEPATYPGPHRCDPTGERLQKQIVVGLLTDELGRPVSIEVFKGNPNDLRTFKNQTTKAQDRFGAKSMAFVGDRGMIEGLQIVDLPEDFHYLTAIAKPQIEALFKKGVLEMELFDATLCEVLEGGVRYNLRRNAIRAQELAANRTRKLSKLEELAAKKTQYLGQHPRAIQDLARREILAKAKKL